MAASSGYPTTKKSLGRVQGYPEDSTQVQSQFNTHQDAGSDHIALDVTQRAPYTVSIGNVVEAGSTKRLIKCTGINARKGDLIKFTSGAMAIIDAPVLNAPDANTIILATELDDVPATGVTFELCRYTFFKVDSNGQIVATSGPNQFKRDGIDTFVSEDTTDVANRPMPMGLMIKDESGNWMPVVLDQTAPYANRPIPVALTDITGSAVVSVTASDLNVKIVHNGADPSSIRIGDGTNLAGVSVNNELKVIDASTLAEIQKLTASLIDGDVSDYTFDNITGQTLYTGVAKKVRIAQNGGEMLYIYKNAVKVGALEAGGKIEFNLSMIVTDSLIVKSKAGTVTTNISWNIFN